MSKRENANFTEDTVALAIESFLSVLGFPRLHFSIELFSRAKERWLGADGRLHREIKGFRPFYMQFKRPSAYPDGSISKIISQRRASSLSVAPRSLFFKLQDKQKNHHDYQHNVLFKLRRRLQRY